MRKEVASTPTDAEILTYTNVPLDVASRYIGWSPCNIRYSLQDQRAPFGFAAPTTEGRWTYNISPGLLVKYKRGDLPTYRLSELEKSMVEIVEELLKRKLGGLNKVLKAVGAH